MATSKRQVSFFVETDLYKKFSKKCIDVDRSKSDVLRDLMENFLKSHS